MIDVLHFTRSNVIKYTLTSRIIFLYIHNTTLDQLLLFIPLSLCNSVVLGILSFFPYSYFCFIHLLRTPLLVIIIFILFFQFELVSLTLLLNILDIFQI